MRSSRRPLTPDGWKPLPRLRPRLRLLRRKRGSDAPSLIDWLLVLISPVWFVTLAFVWLVAAMLEIGLVAILTTFRAITWWRETK